MRRVYVRGTSGSGKSTLARSVAEVLGVPHVELDNHYHQPNWQAPPIEEFRARVAELAAADGWTMDGNYSNVQDILLPRADTVVWLDYDRPLVFRRILLRTIRRCITGEPVCNGNRETFRKSFLERDSVIWWSWSTHARRRAQCEAFMADPAYAHLTRLRFRHPREVEAWLRDLRLGASP